jgi:hypothetical protein
MTASRDGWGGQRAGAGRKPGWKAGPCKAVKLPVALVDQVLAYAHQLDAGMRDHGHQFEPVPPAPPSGDRWAQVAKLIDEKAEHQAELLAGARKKLQLEEARRQELERRIADAGSVLRAAHDEQRRGVRKAIRAADVRSALLALGLDVDAL